MGDAQMVTSGRRASAQPGCSRRRWLAFALVSLYPGTLAVLSLAHLFVQVRGGPLALAEVVAPYLFVPLLVLLPALAVRGAVLPRLAIVACLLGGLQFAPVTRLGAPPIAPPGVTVTVATWNVAFGHADEEAVRRFVEARPAEIVALVEDYGSWWDTDYDRWREREAALARVYPYQVRRNSQGLSILSVYPLLGSSPPSPQVAGADATPVAWGRFDLGQGRTIVVAASHPRNPTRGVCALWRLCFNPAVRDADIRETRAAIAPFLARGDRVLLVGDFNLTEREPAYRDLVAGLWDAQRAVGEGPGHTWRPFPLARFDLALLRIDYVLGNWAIRPLALARNCATSGTDHCFLVATLGIS